MKNVLVLAMLAGTCGVANAQCVEAGCPDPTPEMAELGPGSGQYNSRLTPVWSNGRFPALNGTTYASLWDVFDDIDFTGGPWAGQTGRIITQMQWGIGQAAVAETSTTVAFRFYDASAVDAAGGGFTNTTDMTAGVAPAAIAQFTFASTYAGGAIYTWITAGTSVALPDGIDRFYVRATFHNLDDLNTVWTGAAQAYRWRLANDLTVGSGTTNIALNTFNVNVAPHFTGNDPARGFGVTAPTGTTPEHRDLAYPPSTGTPPAAANGRGIYMVISGEVVVPDPAGTIDMGDLTQDCTSQFMTLAAGETKFFKFTTLDDATRALEKFIDMDTEGSLVNTSMAIWSGAGDGAFIRDDANDGSGDNAQMTFGLGNRAPQGDGRCYDGRDGNTLLARSYIVGVTSGDAVFGPAFSVQNAGSGGQARLNICSNTNGSPIGPSEKPCLSDPIYDLGDVTLMTQAPPPADMTPGNVVWYRMSICPGAADDGNETAEGTYVDIAFNRSFAGSDTDCVMFDDNGHIVADDDDSGPGAFSQLSFGDVSPPRAPFGDGLPFAGQNGALDGGVYWLAVGLFDVTGYEGRWAAYSTSGSSLTANIDIYQAGLEACSTCPVCAADYNQDGGVDGPDVEAFYSDWENALPCADVNQDGGVDGPDVEAFFTLWEAGGCG